jgi:hypothetical protein
MGSGQALFMMIGSSATGWVEPSGRIGIALTRTLWSVTAVIVSSTAWPATVKGRGEEVDC